MESLWLCIVGIDEILLLAWRDGEYACLRVGVEDLFFEVKECFVSRVEFEYEFRVFQRKKRCIAIIAGKIPVEAWESDEGNCFIEVRDKFLYVGSEVF